ncbi:MAG: hypothetical protein R8G01_22915 [Ilumatobacteraceae bacterium]|nr:hypothetical protein [Ilumatobacteraceae bacterium]
MLTMLRRMFWLALLGGAGYAGWTAWQARAGDAPDAAPEWPPLDPPPSATDSVAAAVPSAGPPPSATAAGFVDLPVDDGAAPAPADASSTFSSATWVEPIDGACPEGYPIKANDNSGIFHVPGGRFYERTVPERCYADAHDAEADGYRRSKA